MPHSFRPVEPGDTPENFEGWYHAFILYSVFGAVGVLPNAVLFGTFLSYKTYRRDYKLPLLLCIADTLNCLSIFVVGIYSFPIYERAITEGIVPVETSLSCASRPDVSLRIIASVLSPLVHAAIAFDRFVSVKYPFWYRSSFGKRPHLLPVIVVATVAIFVPVGFYLVFLRRDRVTKFYCGRRSTFGAGYTVAVYSMIVFGYFLSFLSNMISMIILKAMRDSLSEQTMRSLKIATAASFMSFVLISIPNVTSLVDVRIEVSAQMLQISTYLSIIAYSFNFFLYLALNKEFRMRFLRCFTCGKYALSSSSGE